MSVMDYDYRRYTSHGLSFSDYYNYDPLTIQQHSRPDPRGYPLGGPVGGRGRPHGGRDDSMMDNGQQRRRIAVACARCRKRKIRCSGDNGTGVGCTNCRQAGLDPSVCQFHRVGSAEPHKFQDIHVARSLAGLANSGGMMPIYPATPNNQVYGRSMPSPYSRQDTKPVYPSSTWTVPYSEETSPIETYGLEQSAPYLPSPAPVVSNNAYGPSCRWTYPTSKAMQPAPSYYGQDSGYTSHGLPYMQTSNLRASATNESLASPLNMTSLSLTLPERPHPRQFQMADGTATQRQLPMPHPSPAQNSRNVVDQLQDQRLRGGHTNAGATTTSSAGGTAPFSKSLLPWTTSTESPATLVASTPTTASSQPPTTSESFIATTSVPDDTSVPAPTSQHLHLNFSSSSLFDALDAPAPTTTYSTFRDHRPDTNTSARHSSQTSLYGWGADSAPKRNSLGELEGNRRVLVNGQRYMPLPHQPAQPEELRREGFENRGVPLQRASMGNLNSSF